VHGQSFRPMSRDGTMLTTVPPAASARSAATRVAGLPQPLDQREAEPGDPFPRLAGQRVGRRARLSAAQHTNLPRSGRKGTGRHRPSKERTHFTAKRNPAWWDKPQLTHSGCREVKWLSRTIFRPFLISYMV